MVELGESTDAMAILFTGADVWTFGGRAEVTGRMATGGAADPLDETEHGVSGPTGDDAEAAGVDAALPKE